MRGVNATIIIMEEFAYVAPACFFEVVVPLMMIKGVAFIGITTISGKVDNYVNDFIRGKVFDYIEITLICDVCKKAGKVDKCEHKQDERPFWHDEDNMAKIKKIYGDERSDQFARESLGILKQSPNACFDANDVNRLFAKPRESIRQAARYLFLSIDPSGGSQNPETCISDFAVCTHIVPGFQIVGLEAIPCVTEEDYQTRLIEHIQLCFANPMLAGAQLVCAIEGNLAFEANHIQRHIMKHIPSAIFLGNQGAKRGVKTTEESKHLMAKILDSALRKDEVSIIKEFVTTHPEPAKLLQEAKKQLNAYSKLTIPAKTAFDQVRYKYSGKGKNVKDKDDLAIAIQLGFLWSQRFFTTPEFIHLHH